MIGDFSSLQLANFINFKLCIESSCKHFFLLQLHLQEGIIYKVTFFCIFYLRNWSMIMLFKVLTWIFMINWLSLNRSWVSGFYYPSVERNLTVSLLNRYQYYGIFGRPVTSSKEIMTVQYGLQLIQILDLDESQQILRTNCWSTYRWYDRLLEWDPAQHAGITEIRVFPDQIWTPDIKLYNFADARLKESRVARVVVQSTGHILWVPQSIFKSTCEVEITYFPYDTQICMLEFGSWTYDINQLDIQWWIPDDHNESIPYINFSDYMPSPEWKTDGENNMHKSAKERHDGQIKSVKKLRKRRYINPKGNEVIRHYPVLRYVVKLRRNPAFYVSILVIPCVLLSSLTMVVFWLPPESPAKMMLGMNIFVAFFILLQLLEESTPSAVKKFPLIGAFYCLNMVMITLSTFIATLVINLYFKGDQNGPLPRFIRRIMLEGLGRILLVRQYIPLPDEPKLSEKVMTRAENGSLRKCRLKIPNLDSNKFLTSSNMMLRNSTAQSQNMTEYNFAYTNRLSCDMNNDSSVWQAFVQSHTATDSIRGRSNRPQTQPINPITDTEDSPLLMRCHTTLEKDVRELKRYLKVFVNRQKENSRKNLVSMEWRTLALVLDRLFFVLYVTSIFLAVVTCVPSKIEPMIPDHLRD